ncbi:MAG: APC family permease [Kiritimatiellae bacterium]|nr:APC family permease [Kiritimatiellia bacterium]
MTKAFGADHGFLVGWFLLLTYVAILWANSTALVIVARCLFGDALQFGFHYRMVGFDVYFGEVLLCVAVIALCGGICIFRKRLAVGLHTLLAGVMVAGVATCFFVALFRHEGGFASMAPAFAPDGALPVQVLRILAMIPWAFVGFEAVVHSSAEFRFPMGRLFALMVAAIALSALAYILLTVFPVLSLPEGVSSWTEYLAALPGGAGVDSMPVFAAARRTLGAAGVAILGGTMLAAQLTGMFATYVAVSRLMLAMSDDGMLPRWFGAVNRDGTPVRAVLFVMCASFAIPFFGRTVTGWPVDVSSLGAAIAYGYVSAAAYAVARREGAGGWAAGAAGVEMLKKFEDVGFTGILLKPVTVDKLKAIL